MHWSMVGWSHHQTPVELREKLAFNADQVVDALAKLNDEFPGVESVLLSTCNRVELYCVSSDPNGKPSNQDLTSFLSGYHGLRLADVEEHATQLTGPDSIKHLFTVAASLDSMVIGEAQIISQVKSAYELASDHAFISKRMHQAFQRAVAVARRVTNETEIHRKRVSVPSVAVSEIASEFFERFDDKRILLIGAGDMGKETLQYLIDHGARHIQIVNRHMDRAQNLAEEFGAVAADWNSLYENIVNSDLIVSTTGATEIIVEAGRFKEKRQHQSPRAMLILDLAVPRDIDPEIADLPDVYLYTLDDLQVVCEQNIEARKEQWPKALRIVEDETKRFLAELAHGGSGATIKQLREQANKVKEEELQRLLGKLQSHDLAEPLQKELEISFDRLVNKLLHPPMKSLRENANTSQHAGLLEALRRLFQLRE